MYNFYYTNIAVLVLSVWIILISGIVEEDKVGGTCGTNGRES
jgi:hypothetical protein